MAPHRVWLEFGMPRVGFYIGTARRTERRARGARVQKRGPVREYALCAGNAIDMKKRTPPRLPPSLPFVMSAPTLMQRRGGGRAAPLAPPGVTTSRAPPSHAAPTRHMNRGAATAAGAAQRHVQRQVQLHRTSSPPPGRKRAASASHPATPEGRNTLWRLADRNPVLLHASTPPLYTGTLGTAWRVPPDTLTPRRTAQRALPPHRKLPAEASAPQGAHGGIQLKFLRGCVGTTRYPWRVSGMTDAESPC